MTEWKVDIITMSFGYPEEQPVIGDAIHMSLVLQSKLLFFAAAANEGSNEADMFPANDDNVISIRGSDSEGWLRSSSTLHDETCFMTLGRDVPCAALSSGEDSGGYAYKSGTSVATPIAAGIAAIILGFARVSESDLKRRLGNAQEAKLTRLGTRAGMTSMLRLISSESSHRCRFLAPKAKFTGISVDDNQRQHVIENAIRLL